ncbi:hypothetical protein [Saccharolobus caldissimus]|uniref:Uncharacterized protein n=1 Tax=Saccharolobus caldissimus TaxID=1702097 RepID=A0AAQ4CSB5_9CREN|nr:hypothetical protein [Saccharolobus caldissimus]BDB98696.1 hypothetical protein SACC_17130 [Saccharolobus caldissimus]
MVIYKLDCYRELCNNINNNILCDENSDFLALARDPEWEECQDVVKGICSRSIRINELTVKSCNKGSMADWFILYRTGRRVIGLIIECKINWTPNINELLDPNSDFIKQLAAETIINLLMISELCIEKHITKVHFILVLKNTVLNYIRKAKFRDGSEKVEEEILRTIRQNINNVNLSMKFELCEGNQQTITCDNNFKLDIPCC